MKKIVSLILSLALLALCAGALADTFAATAAGFGGDVTVTLSVEDGKLAGVEIAGPAETEALGGAAMPVLADEILAAQSPYVDAVAGASVTSAAVVAAAEQAFAAAGLTVDKPEEVKGEDETAASGLNHSSTYLHLCQPCSLNGENGSMFPS